MKTRIAVLLLLALVFTGVSCSRPPKADKPNIGGSLVSGFGAIPGTNSPDRQRFHYEADLSNLGGTLPSGWRWEVTIAPELLSRALATNQDPPASAAGSSSTSDWARGETHKFTGYVDFNAADLTKEAIMAIPSPVVIRIVNASGSEVTRMGAK